MLKKVSNFFAKKLATKRRQLKLYYIDKTLLEGFDNYFWVR